MSSSGVVNIVNNRGPTTDLCGTRVSNEIVDDEILPILTKLVLAVKYDLIHFNAVPVTLEVSESLIRRTCKMAPLSGSPFYT